MQPTERSLLYYFADAVSSAPEQVEDLLRVAEDLAAKRQASPEYTKALREVKQIVAKATSSGIDDFRGFQARVASAVQKPLSSAVDLAESEAREALRRVLR
jgi:hypothetical protein